MSSFTDVKGDSWEVKYDYQTVTRCIQLIGLNPLSLMDDEYRLLRELSGDMVRQVDLIYASVSKQAEERGITQEEFAARLFDGDVLESAFVAVQDAVVFTFPLRRREIANEGLQKLRSAHEQLIGMAGEKLNSLDAQKLATDMWNSLSNSLEPAESPPGV